MFQILNPYIKKRFHSISMCLCLLLFNSFSLICDAHGGQHFSYEDEHLIEQTLHKYDLKNLAFGQPAKPSSEQYAVTLHTLNAIHQTQAVKLYSFIAKRIIYSQQRENSQLSNLIRSKADFNPTQLRVYQGMIAEAEENELTQWLRNYIHLDKLLVTDTLFYSDLFNQLTQEMVNLTTLCPELTSMGDAHYIKTRRRIILKCISREIDSTFIDLDISKNRLVQSDIITPDTLNVKLRNPITVSLDNFDSHAGTLIELLDDSDIEPVLLITTPKNSGFIFNRQKVISTRQADQLSYDQKTNTKNDITNSAELQYQSSAIRREKKPYQPDKVAELIVTTSPAITIPLMIGLSAAIVLAFIYTPWPGNPFLY